MPVYYHTQDLPVFKNAVLTIGTFDGVHLGHQKILQEVVRQATLASGESVVISFEPHPRKILFPQEQIRLLTSLKQKLELLTAAGIQHCMVQTFSRDFSNLSANDYIEHFLVKHFHPHTIIIGYDHRFGHDRSGDIVMLKEFAERFGYKVFEIPAQLIDEAAVSSTKIRKAVAEGNMEDAAHMLGRDYSICGTVQRGAMIGRTIGFPTANILPLDADQLIPKIGVYAVRVKWKEHLHNGMLNIGYNPTVTDEKKLMIEVNIFDFERDVYNEELEIFFVSRLRDEEKFPSLEVLKEQLKVDKINSLKILGYA